MSPSAPTARTAIRRQLGLGLPACLLFLGSIAVLCPDSNVAFLVASVGSAAAALLAAYRLLFELREIRISWLLGTGLLLGYGLGTVNTIAQFQFEYARVVEYFGKSSTDLSLALAVSLWIPATLFLFGAFIEHPLRFDLTKINSDDRYLVWAGIALIAAAVVQGNLGYMGVSSSSAHHVSAVADLAGLLAPVLPAFTILVQSRCRSVRHKVVLWVLFAFAVLSLVPQGRRVMLYALAVALFAFSSTGFSAKNTRLKRLVALGICLLTLYLGNIAFYAMRYSIAQSGRKELSLSETTSRAVQFLQNGRDSRFDQALSQNQRDRTFILAYFSDLLAGSWKHEPLYGRDALFCARMAIPSRLTSSKDEVLDVGMEESLANPQFGLPVDDEANSILTTGVSDFGILGAFAYPILLTMLIGAFVRLLSRNLPEAIKLIVLLALVNMMLQTELSGNQYLVFCRDIVILALLLLPVKGFSRLRPSLNEGLTNRKLFARLTGKHAAFRSLDVCRPE